MDAEVSTQPQNAGRRWFYRRDLDSLLVVAWVYLPHLARRFGFVYAVALALSMCYCIASFVDHGDLSDWKPLYRWTVGACAVAVAVWLFVSTPTLAGRTVAVIAYGSLYWFCDRTLQQRLREARIR